MFALSNLTHSGSRCPCNSNRRRSKPFQAFRGQKRTFAVQSSLAVAENVLSLVKSAGAAADKVLVEQDLATGKPVLVAATDISAGDIIASIPENAWISPQQVQRSQIGQFVSGLEPWLQLALYILHVKHSKDENAYVASLPESANCTLLWSKEELAELQGTQLLENTLAYKAFFQERFSQLQESLFPLQPTLFAPEAFTFEKFLWAAATVRSRLFAPLEGADAALVPLADMVTHKRGVLTQWKVATTGLINKKQLLQVAAGKAFRRGETISMDYGPTKVDNQLLLDYGVFDAVQKKPGYGLSLSIPDTEQFLDDKLDILESNGLQQTMQFLLTPGEPPSEEMMAFLRLMQLQTQDVFLLEAIFRGEVWGHMQLPVSEYNEELVCQAMVTGAQEALVLYPTAIEDDLMLLRSGTVEKGSRQWLAIQIRLGEKEALNSTLLWFEQRLTELKTVEYYQERRLKRLGLVDEKGRSTFDGFFKGGIA